VDYVVWALEYIGLERNLFLCREPPLWQEVVRPRGEVTRITLKRVEVDYDASPFWYKAKMFLSMRWSVSGMDDILGSNCLASTSDFWRTLTPTKYRRK
jgi:hypothetical protein